MITLSRTLLRGCGLAPEQLTSHLLWLTLTSHHVQDSFEGFYSHIWSPAGSGDVPHPFSLDLKLKVIVFLKWQL